MANFSTAAVSQSFSGKTSDYIKSRYKSIPQDADLDVYENTSVQEIENYIKSSLLDKYGYSEEDIDYLLFFNQKIVLPSNYEKGGAVENAAKFFSDKLNMSNQEFKELILHYPIYLRFNGEKLNERIKYYLDLGL